MAQDQKYDELSSELDKVIAALQAPDISVDKALELYEEGSKLISQLQNYLQNAQNTINKIKVDIGEEA